MQWFLTLQGLGSGGRLGLGHEDSARSPCAVPLPLSAAKRTITAIACGHAHSAALTAGGGVLLWGVGANGALGTAAAANRTMAEPSDAVRSPTHLALGLSRTASPSRRKPCSAPGPCAAVAFESGFLVGCGQTCRSDRVRRPDDGGDHRRRRAVVVGQGGGRAECDQAEAARHDRAGCDRKARARVCRGKDAHACHVRTQYPI
jgi:alpha-tubulin suppressor-like RCC1 family protein